MANIIMAAFDDRDDAGNAITELEDMGVDADDISVIASTNAKDVNRAAAAASNADDAGTDMAEGAVGGATTGGAIGGLAGLLAGAGVFPALAGLLIGGPIAAALGLTGVAATTVSGAVTGAVAGGLIGALTGLGVSEEDAQAYEETIKSGGLVLAVPADTINGKDPRDVLEGHNAMSVSEVNVRERTRMM
jgi:hypothetical protein